MPGPPPERPHLRLLKGNPSKRRVRVPPEPACIEQCPEPLRGSDGARWRAERRHTPPPITVADVQTLIACALAEERSAVIPALRSAIDELLQAERTHVKNETAQARLEVSIAKLESALAALQLTLVAERSGKTLDLPNPLSRVN
jgi:hypothetical protein